MAAQGLALQVGVANREPVTRLCMSIDVQKGSVFVAQRAFTQRLNNLRGACMGIAALWNQV